MRPSCARSCTVRGPIASFAEPGKVAATAALSANDGLVLCLLAPPESRTETVLLARAKRAYGRLLTIEDATANVRRLHELEAGMPFLVRSFERRIDGARDSAELAALERAFDKAPIEEAKRAVRSELLLAAFDEPGEPGGPTAIDGEHAHDVRVVLVSGTTLLRVRRHVDPGLGRLYLGADPVCLPDRLVLARVRRPCCDHVTLITAGARSPRGRARAGRCRSPRAATPRGSAR